MKPHRKHIVQLWFGLCWAALGTGASASPPPRQSGFILEASRDSICYRIVTSDGERILLTSGPYLRAGREPTIAEYRSYSRAKLRFWQPPVLTKARLLSRTATTEQSHTVFLSPYQFHRPEKPSERILLDLKLTLSPQG